MINDLISVIVPVYNVKNYLSNCLKSIVSQTYKDLEIIIIDDGSTDGSSEICEKFADEDARIIVIHQGNGGAANAKNEGLRIAKGEYLAFVDSDDFLEVDSYEYMLEQLKKFHADVIQCGFRNVYVNSCYDSISFDSYKEFSVQEYLQRFTVDWTCGLLWDKLYRRELFMGIYFKEGHKIDDEFFTYRGIINAKKIIYLPKIVYNYRKRGSGIMLSESSSKKIIFDKLDYLKVRRKNIVDSFPNLASIFDDHYANMLLALLREPYASKESIMQTKKQIKEFLMEKHRPQIKIGLMLQLIHVLFVQDEKLLINRKSASSYKLEQKYFE